jgi:hypothetical protein
VIAHHSVDSPGSFTLNISGFTLTDQSRIFVKIVQMHLLVPALMSTSALKRTPRHNDSFRHVFSIDVSPVETGWREPIVLLSPDS